MSRAWLCVIGGVLPAVLVAQTGTGPYARIAVLRPHDGQTTEFEAGYLRHLQWHREAGDSWVWYGWSIWAGDRYRWFVYATFGHSAASFDSVVSPPDDERDNLVNVAPHVEWVTNGMYEFLPGLSRGTGEPAATSRVEYTSLELLPGAGPAFEKMLRAVQPKLRGETLWYRMLAGGSMPRYVRFRPEPGLGALLGDSPEQTLPDAANPMITKLTTEIWTLRRAMSLGLPER